MPNAKKPKRDPGNSHGSTRELARFPKTIPKEDPKESEERKKKKERLEQIRLNKLKRRDEILVTKLYLE